MRYFLYTKKDGENRLIAADTLQAFLGLHSGEPYSELSRIPELHKERLDANGNIVPIVATKEELVKAAESTLQTENYALAKMVLELREKLAANGETLTPVPKELSDKLTAIDSLKAVEAPREG